MTFGTFFLCPLWVCPLHLSNRLGQTWVSWNGSTSGSKGIFWVQNWDKISRAPPFTHFRWNCFLKGPWTALSQHLKPCQHVEVLQLGVFLLGHSRNLSRKEWQSNKGQQVEGQDSLDIAFPGVGPNTSQPVCTVATSIAEWVRFAPLKSVSVREISWNSRETLYLYWEILSRFSHKMVFVTKFSLLAARFCIPPITNLYEKYYLESYSS